MYITDAFTYFRPYASTICFFRSAASLAEDVKLLKEGVAGKCKVKAAGGVKTHEDFLKMIELGADRIGTSSGTKLIEK